MTPSLSSDFEAFWYSKSQISLNPFEFQKYRQVPRSCLWNIRIRTLTHILRRYRHGIILLVPYLPLCRSLILQFCKTIFLRQMVAPVDDLVTSKVMPLVLYSLLGFFAVSFLMFIFMYLSSGNLIPSVRSLAPPYTSLLESLGTNQPFAPGLLVRRLCFLTTTILECSN